MSKMEIPGCASGVNSLIHLRLGVTHDCDGEICLLPKEDMEKAADNYRNSQLNLSLLNNGVHSGVRFILSSTHTGADIEETIESFESSLDAIRTLGLI